MYCYFAIFDGNTIVRRCSSEFHAREALSSMHVEGLHIREIRYGYNGERRWVRI